MKVYDKRISTLEIKYHVHGWAQWLSMYIELRTVTVYKWDEANKL